MSPDLPSSSTVLRAASICTKSRTRCMGSERKRVPMAVSLRTRGRCACACGLGGGAGAGFWGLVAACCALLCLLFGGHEAAKQRKKHEEAEKLAFALIGFAAHLHDTMFPFVNTHDEGHSLISFISLSSSLKTFHLDLTPFSFIKSSTISS